MLSLDPTVRPVYRGIKNKYIREEGRGREGGRNDQIVLHLKGLYYWERKSEAEQTVTCSTHTHLHLQHYVIFLRLESQSFDTPQRSMPQPQTVINAESDVGRSDICSGYFVYIITGKCNNYYKSVQNSIKCLC
jgi:hypothetical protein